MGKPVALVAWDVRLEHADNAHDIRPVSVTAPVFEDAAIQAEQANPGYVAMAVQMARGNQSIK